MTPPPPHSAPDVTTGELGRRLDELRTDVLRLGDKMERVASGADLQALGVAWQASLDATERRIEDHQKAQDERLAKLEGWNDWATRLVLGAVALAVIGVAVAAPGGF